MSGAVGARRVAFAVLALALAGAAALAYLQAGKVDDRLSLEARRTAEHAAEAVASRLTIEDIQQPMGEGRAGTISSFVERRLLDPSESVTIWSADSVVVFAADPALIGTEDRGLLTQISHVLSDGTQTETAGGSVHTFVAVVVGEGEGRPVVAEVIRPDEASPAGHPWIYASIAAAFLALLVLVAAVRTSGRQGYRPNGFGVDDLRRERKNLLQAQEALERSRTEEANLRSELERVAGDLARTKETLASKETTIGEVDSRARAAEEQAARAEAELRAGVTVREEVARLIDTELQTARSELAMTKQQHEEAQRQLESRRMAEAEREAAEAERDVLEAERDAIAAERDALRSLDERLRGELDAAKANLDIISREMTELGNRYQESAARAAHAEAKVLELNADRRELEGQRDPTGELQRTHAELEMTKNELGAALQKLETLGEWLVVSRGDLEVVRGEQELGNAELEGARAELEGTRAELEGARAELDAVRAQFHAVRTELDSARDEATSSSGVRDWTLFELDSIRTQQETTTVALDEAREELSASKAALEIARSNEERALAEAAEARSSFEAVSADLSNAREETEAAWAEATALTGRMDEHVERAASAEARALELSQWVTELESRPDLAPALEDAKAAFESARDQLRDRDARFAAARDELDSIRIQQERTTAALDEASKKLSASEAALGSARLELETARSNERQALAEAAEARSSFDAVSADLSTSQEETEAALAEATALARRVDEHVERAAHAEARESELWQRITDLESRPDLTPALEDAMAALESAKDQLGDRDARFAEAQNELGNSGTAVTYLNMIRARARNGTGAENRPEPADYAGATDQLSVRDAIYMERAWELSFEAKRWFDLVRRDSREPGYWATSLQTHDLNSTNQGPLAGYKKRFPIPLGQISSNPALCQNPGYGGTPCPPGVTAP